MRVFLPVLSAIAMFKAVGGSECRVGEEKTLRQSLLQSIYTCFNVMLPCEQTQPVHLQVDKTVAGFTDAGSATLAQGGLYLGGTKYLVIPGDPGAVIRGKKGQVSSSVSPHCRLWVDWLRHQAIHIQDCL